MLTRVDELEAFKSRINLAEYAASCGYVLVRKESSRSSLLLSHPNGDKVVVAMGKDRHWTYFSVRDDADHGSIVDFVQRRQGGSLGEVRKVLRPFLEGTHSPALPETLPILEPASKDLVQVRVRLEAMTVTATHPYLLNERKIPAEVLSHRRFLERVRIDDHGNAVFPHWNLSGLSGYELKNHHFTGFAPGGEKGLWASRTSPGDSALVVCETAIDALSHFALRRLGNARYLSTAGSLNPAQPELLRRAAERLPEGSRVIIATDNDPGGDALALAIREALGPLGGRVEILEDRPALRGTDWNDVLRGKA